jgi:hypothetical protein
MASDEPETADPPSSTWLGVVVAAAILLAVAAVGRTYWQWHQFDGDPNYWGQRRIDYSENVHRQVGALFAVVVLIAGGGLVLQRLRGRFRRLSRRRVVIVLVCAALGVLLFWVGYSDNQSASLSADDLSANQAYVLNSLLWVGAVAGVGAFDGILRKRSSSSVSTGRLVAGAVAVAMIAVGILAVTPLRVRAGGPSAEATAWMEVHEYPDAMFEAVNSINGAPGEAEVRAACQGLSDWAASLMDEPLAPRGKQDAVSAFSDKLVVAASDCIERGTPGVATIGEFFGSQEADDLGTWVEP